MGLGLAAAPADELFHRLVGEREVRVRHAHLLACRRLEVAARDLHLVGVRVGVWVGGSWGKG